MRKVQIPSIITSPEREAPNASTKRSAALRSPTGITPLGIYPVFIATKGGGRPTRRLPRLCQNAACTHKFFPLLGRLCSGRFYIFNEQM